MSESPYDRWQREREHARELEQAGINPATGAPVVGTPGARRGRPIALTDRAVRPEGLRRRELLDQAEALMHDGSFADDAARAAFDALLDQVDALGAGGGD